MGGALPNEMMQYVAMNQFKYFFYKQCNGSFQPKRQKNLLATIYTQFFSFITGPVLLINMLTYYK